MNTGFIPNTTSELITTEDTTIVVSGYELTISNEVKTIQKTYLGVKGEDLIIDDFDEVGEWVLTIKNDNKIVFRKELINK